MKNLVRTIGAIAATAFAIAPMVTTLNPRAGAIIAIIAAGAAAFGPALIDKNRARSQRRNASSRGSRTRVGVLLLLGILPLALFSAACSDVVKRAAQGLAVAAVSLDEGIQLKRDLRVEGELTRDAELEITRTMLEVDRTLIQITDTAKCFERYTADVRTTLINASGDVAIALDNLNRNGVLHIRSQAAQRRFRDWIRGARLTASSLRAALEAVEAQDPPAEGQPAPEMTAKQREAINAGREICERASRQLHENETQLLNDLKLLEAPAEQS